MNRWNSRGGEPPAGPGGPSRSSASARRAGPSDLADVAQAALKTLRALIEGTERRELLELEEALHRAVFADEVREIARRLEHLRVGRIRVELPQGSREPGPAPVVVQPILQATRRVAESVGARDAAETLARESAPGAQAPDRVVSAAVAALEETAEAGARLVERCEALEGCLAAAVDTLGRLTAAEEETASSAQRVSDRLRLANDADGLFALQAILLQQADALVQIATQRESEARLASAAVQANMERIQVLESRLQEVTELASTDPLTKLGNRRALGLAVARLAGRGDTGLLAVDIDHFKSINDRYGHAVGDEVLQQFAALVRSELRTDDLAFRVGGEEVVVLLPGVDWSGARSTGNRLRVRVGQEPMKTRGGRVTVTVSIGIGMWFSGEPFENASERADAALYRAKSNGRNCVVG